MLHMEQEEEMGSWHHVLHVEQDLGGDDRLPGVPVAGRSLQGPGIDRFFALWRLLVQTNASY